jgi:RNA polymerase sigma-70 factor (sigma-E family)
MKGVDGWAEHDKDGALPRRRRRWLEEEPEPLFDAVYRQERDRLVRLAYLLTGSQGAAEDLVQDVFVRAGTRIETVDEPAAYLRRSVTNACWSWHRRRRREERLTPERAAVVAGTSDIEMWDALARLSTRRRHVLVLRYYLDLPEAEVAELLGCRVGTVKSATHRALKDLRRVVEQ